MSRDQHEKTILIMEDDRLLLELWANILNKQGYHVLKATDTLHAYKLATGEYPDLIMMDLVMQNSENLSMIEKLYKNNLMREIPVMFVRGWMAAGSIRQSYMNNNKDIKNLIQNIKRVFQPRENARQAKDLVLI